MAGYKQKGYDSGAPKPGSEYNENWTEANYDLKRSRNFYGSKNITLEENIGDDRMSNLSQYRQDKINNRSEVKFQRHIADEQRKVDRGTGKSPGEIRRANRQRRRELRKLERTQSRTARRNARNN
tara:strand:- start:655 stop:1029 length:375 start_codon:yes stop_codon:yes gene_type:complete